VATIEQVIADLTDFVNADIGKGTLHIESVYLALQALRKLAEYEDTGLSPAEVAELAQAKADGRLVVLPVSVGDTVWRLCKCSDIPSRLDGTMYSDDGSPGTATGYYCPYENNCPHDTDDCEKVKDKIQIFEDCAEAINISEGGIWFFLEYTPNVDLSDFGKTVFLTREEAEKALKECDKWAELRKTDTYTSGK
jgi:hypothetical protein